MFLFFIIPQIGSLICKSSVVCFPFINDTMLMQLNILILCQFLFFVISQRGWGVYKMKQSIFFIGNRVVTPYRLRRVNVCCSVCSCLIIMSYVSSIFGSSTKTKRGSPFSQVTLRVTRIHPCVHLLHSLSEMIDWMVYPHQLLNLLVVQLPLEPFNISSSVLVANKFD